MFCEAEACKKQPDRQTKKQNKRTDMQTKGQTDVRHDSYSGTRSEEIQRVHIIGEKIAEQSNEEQYKINMLTKI